MGNLADGTGSLYFNSNSTFRTTITASSNISASGHISCSGLIVAGSEVTIKGGVITAEGFVGPLTASGITSTGPGTFTTIDTGQGATEVYAMNQDVETGDAVTFADITATGDLTVTGDVSASGLLTVDTLTIGATYNNTSITFSDLAFTNNNKAFSITTTLPTIGSGTYCDDTTVTNSSVTTNSVIIASANRGVSVFCHTIAAGSFKFTATGFATDFSSASVRINFIVL